MVKKSRENQFSLMYVCRGIRRRKIGKFLRTISAPSRKVGEGEYEVDDDDDEKLNRTGTFVRANPQKDEAPSCSASLNEPALIGNKKRSESS